MFLVNLSYTQENLWAFVKHNVLSSTPFRRALKYVYFAVLAIMLIFGVVMAIFMGNILYAVLMTCMALVFFFVGVFMMRTLKSAANSMYKELAEQNGMQAALNADIIYIRNGEQSAGYMTWDSVETITLAHDFAYLTTKSNALLLLEYKQIVSGDKAALEQLLTEKSTLIKQSKRTAKTTKTGKNETQ
jgi:hypothetical protein